jgi:hypothetical protein
MSFEAESSVRFVDCYELIQISPNAELDTVQRVTKPGPVRRVRRFLKRTGNRPSHNSVTAER